MERFNQNPRRLPAWLSVLILTAIILTAFFINGKKAGGYSAIEIADTASGKVYGRQIINDTDEFAIEFIHSVNNSAVREIFRAADKKIQITAVRFYAFGAGMQTELEEGLTMTRDGDAYIISGFNRTVSELNYIVGTVSDHLLITDDAIISLRDLCGKNAHVTLRIR